MIITLISGKGGVGKSLLACHLASHWHGEGFKVLLVDADPQGSAIDWADRAEANGHEGPTVVAVGDAIRRQVPKLSADYDITIIDTPGRQSKRGVGALLESDIGLIPCGPGPQDLWALGDTLELVEQAQSLREDLRVGLVINRALRTALSRSVAQRAGELGFPVLSTVIAQRTAQGEAIAVGQGVTAYGPRSKAAEEIRSLAKEIVELINAEQADVA